MDGKFETLLKSILWSRNMYDSFTKFVQFQITTNLVVVLTALFTLNTHITPFLLMNMIIDTLFAFSLASDNPHKEQLMRKPRNRQASLISTVMWRKILGQVIFQTTLITIAFYSCNYMPIFL